MAKQVRAYNPKDVYVLVDGVHLMGFSEDTIVEVEKTEDNMIVHDGVKGEVSVAINASSIGTAKVSIASTSPSLSYLQDLAMDRALFPLQIIDMNDDGRNVSCEDCWIIKAPDKMHKKEVEDIEVEIQIPYLEW